ncbi:MAG: hypothetical protein AAF499_04615 [Pseudomonadota bacterium]
MKYSQLIEDWGLKGLKINLGVLEAEFQPNDPDRNAAWALYIELLTRITTQPLPKAHGDEATALDSVYSLFAVTRDLLKGPDGRHAIHFAKIAIVVLNQKIRPFTAKWHKAKLDGAFDDPEACDAFRTELADLQDQLRRYAGLLSQLAGVEDLNNLEDV